MEVATDAGALCESGAGRTGSCRKVLLWEGEVITMSGLPVVIWAVIFLFVMIWSWFEDTEIKGDWYLAFAAVLLILFVLEAIREEIGLLRVDLAKSNYIMNRSLDTIEQTLDRIKTLLENRTGGF